MRPFRRHRLPSLCPFDMSITSTSPSSLKHSPHHTSPSTLRISLALVIILFVLLSLLHFPLPSRYTLFNPKQQQHQSSSESAKPSDDLPLTSIADPESAHPKSSVTQQQKQEKQSSQLPSPAQPQRPPPQLSISNRCLLYPLNPSASLWQFNSRTLCTFSHLCINITALDQPVLHIPPSTSCQISSTPDLLTHLADGRLSEWQGGCEDLQHRALCVFGNGSERDEPVCPPLVHLPQLSREQEEGGEQKEEVVVFVPRYPYMANIYHFLTVATGLVHVLDELPRLVEGVAGRGVRVVWRGWEIGAGWQQELLRVLLAGRASLDGVEYLGMHGGCWKGAVVVMGIRAHVNLWPFLNATYVPVDGMSVPKSAVRFKQRFYDEFGIGGKRIKDGEAEGDEEELVSELPPLVLGYSRRLGIEDSVGLRVHAGGTKRRFNKEDEEWFGEMLKEECESGGVRLKVFTITGEESLREQVANIIDIGFLVGIHGANLVNGVFMRPFGSLFEIQPNGSTSPCYIAGANSGLAYWKYETRVRATMEESGCEPDDEHCRTKLRQRLVKIGTEEDRTEIRQIVRLGINRLKELHQRFPDGIPVVYNKATAYYDVKTAR